ncbi:hypothetical protein [Synechococcus elongatus]|uniref:hypothetical protein n=1 Tax=Synechococcus elongatus TaxID=32046 RepID=UPI0030D5B8CE
MYPKNQLVRSITSSESTDLLSSLVDTGIDAAVESGALDGVPIVGLLFGAVRAGRNIREGFLLHKLVHFLRETSALTPEERLSFQRQFQNDEKAEEFGGLVVILLERADDLAKPVILGRLLVAYAKGMFSQDKFLRLARMVDRSFTDDLQLLKDFSSGLMTNKEVQAQSLSSLGFLYEIGSDAGEYGNPNSGGNLYQISPYGELLVQYGLDS